MIFSLLLLLPMFVGSFTATPTTSTTPANSPAFLKKTLAAEYLSFFNPIQKNIYSPDMVFTDCLSRVTGIDAYAKNIGLIDGKGIIGGTVFGSGRGRIYLHRVDSDDSETDGKFYGITTYVESCERAKRFQPGFVAPPLVC